jgi:hypothetical protein
MWPQCVASVILFSRNAAGTQLAFVPIGSSNDVQRPDGTPTDFGYTPDGEHRPSSD